MHYIAANVKKLIEMKGLSLSEFSRQTGVSKATVSRWFNEDKIPRFDIVEKIASTYDLPIDFFIDESFTEYWKYRDGEWMEKENPDEEPTFEVAAGPGRVNTDRGTGEYSTIKIVGDSMYPSLHDGDLLKVHHIADGIPPHKFAIVKVNGDEVTCKHIEITNEGIWLRAENKEVFQDKFYSVQEVLTLPVTIIGVATELISRKL
jgi:repressor LexA